MPGRKNSVRRQGSAGPPGGSGASFRLHGRWYEILTDSPAPGNAGRTGETAPAEEESGPGVLSVGGRRYRIVPAPAPSGTRKREPERHPLDLLTERELQVVALVASGLINKEVAAKLRISEWTVSTHMRRIFSKLGVDTRAAMIFKCFHHLDAHEV